jgi:hypothetical protein
VAEISADLQTQSDISFIEMYIVFLLYFVNVVYIEKCFRKCCTLHIPTNYSSSGSGVSQVGDMVWGTTRIVGS